MTNDYEGLIESFLAKRLSAGEFEKLYLQAFKREPGGTETNVFEILEKLFSDVDSYSPDCQQGKESAFEISEVELRRQAAKALNGLRQLRDHQSVSQR